MRTVTEREREFYDRFWSEKESADAEGELRLPGVSVAGKRLLVCACGNGQDAVRAARAGAEVYAFDISPVGVQRTKGLADRYGCTVRAEVMDFHHLTYPDEMFDLAYGSWVLHHVDCEKAGKELYRVLRPGGMAVFEENSDRNPLIRWVRRTLLGKPDGIQKKQFLFIRRYGSNDEYPLTDEEVDRLRQIFGTIEIRYVYFVFFGLIATHIWRHGTLKRITDWLDRAVVRLFPKLMEYSFCRYIVLEKPHPPSRP